MSSKRSNCLCFDSGRRASSFFPRSPELTFTRLRADILRASSRFRSRKHLFSASYMHLVIHPLISPLCDAQQLQLVVFKQLLQEQYKVAEVSASSFLACG